MRPTWSIGPPSSRWKSGLSSWARQPCSLTLPLATTASPALSCRSMKRRPNQMASTWPLASSSVGRRQPEPPPVRALDADGADRGPHGDRRPGCLALQAAEGQRRRADRGSGAGRWSAGRGPCGCPGGVHAGAGSRHPAARTCRWACPARRPRPRRPGCDAARCPRFGVRGRRRLARDGAGRRRCGEPEAAPATPTRPRRGGGRAAVRRAPSRPRRPGPAPGCGARRSSTALAGSPAP